MTVPNLGVIQINQPRSKISFKGNRLKVSATNFPVILCINHVELPFTIYSKDAVFPWIMIT